MKIKDLRELSHSDLNLKKADLKKELLMLRIQRVNGRLEQSHLLASHKRTIARILTVLEEKRGEVHV
ncbi:MAG: 50S ribosomal protein L29 [Leptospirillum sp.]|jgi:large subunit ribosomal protein L29